MATTTSSLRISIEPLEMKYRAVRISPLWTRVSPGGAWVVLNRMARARRQPLLAPRKALQFCSKLRFKWRQISACRHSGKPFKTCRKKWDTGNLTLSSYYVSSLSFCNIKKEVTWKHMKKVWRGEKGSRVSDWCMQGIKDESYNW